MCLGCFCASGHYSSLHRQYLFYSKDVTKAFMFALKFIVNNCFSFGKGPLVHSEYLWFLLRIRWTTFHYLSQVCKIAGLYQQIKNKRNKTKSLIQAAIFPLKQIFKNRDLYQTMNEYTKMSIIFLHIQTRNQDPTKGLNSLLIWKIYLLIFKSIQIYVWKIF